jgi:hypothetical protein
MNHMNGNRVNVKFKSDAWRILLCVLLIGLPACGCAAPKPGDATPILSLEAQMQVNAGQEFHASLGVKNTGQVSFAGDDAFDGEMELRYADGERAGELRARAEIRALSRIEPGDAAWPTTWRGRLDPGAYTLTWGADRYGETRIQFQIVERDGRLYLGALHQAQTQQQVTARHARNGHRRSGADHRRI